MKYEIDPTNITNHSQTRTELELALVFWVLVAGKPAIRTAQKLTMFLSRLAFVYGSGTPFELLRDALEARTFEPVARSCGLGKYKLIKRAFVELVDLDPRSCTLAQLEAVPGIGPKTARCFLLHSRPGQRVAALDTHVLKYLGEHGYDVPKTTPTGRKYRELEQAFLELCDLTGLPPAELDLAVWNYYSTGTQ